MDAIYLRRTDGIKILMFSEGYYSHHHLLDLFSFLVTISCDSCSRRLNVNSNENKAKEWPWKESCVFPKSSTSPYGEEPKSHADVRNKPTK